MPVYLKIISEKLQYVPSLEQREYSIYVRNIRTKNAFICRKKDLSLNDRYLLFEFFRNSSLKKLSYARCHVIENPAF